MPAPDPQTLAPRSGLVPQCAKRGKPLACLLVLLSACLNPMPEEFPSNDDAVPVIGGVPGSSPTGSDEANGSPIIVPDQSGPGDIFGGGAGTGGSGGNIGPPLSEAPTNTSGEDEPAAPDAGPADAGAPSAEATGTEEDETTP
jgi:hypothetical protein